MTHSNTNPRSGQYLTHAHSHITRAVVAMDSCFGLVRLHQHGVAVGQQIGLKALCTLPFTAKAGAKQSPICGPTAIPCWWGLTRPKQLSMAATAWLIWLCACVMHWPDRGLVFERVTCFYSRTSRKRPPIMTRIGDRLWEVVAYQSSDHRGSKFLVIYIWKYQRLNPFASAYRNP